MNSFNSFFIVLFTLVFSANAQAGLTRKSQSQAELQQAVQLNQTLQSKYKMAPATTGQPALETDKFRYILMNGTDLDVDNLVAMQKAFALNLPQDMMLVVVTENSDAADVKKKFLQWIPAERLIVASGKNLGDTLWGRDSYPYPVYQNDNKSGVELIAHDYFRAFNAKDLIANSVNAQNVKKPGFIAVGGNIMGTAKGECFIVNSDRTFGLTDSSYKSSFRCKSVVRFPWVAGIGDVDEVIKVLPNDVVLTNQSSYVKTLQGLGYKVTMLPQPKSGEYRTYANSVILGDTVFMPIYSDVEDDNAKKVYETFGYKVIGVPSDYLSDEMLGSVHCLTMTYPDMELQTLLKFLGLTHIK